MKIETYGKFWQRIHNSARKRGFLLRVMFELTYRCNFRCKHCYIPEDYKKQYRRELNKAEIFSILDQLRDLGCFYLGFTGGEPFLREDIFDILWHAKKKGFQIIIYTNGSLIDKDKAGELKCLSPNKVDITLPAMSRDIFERITGLKGSRDKVFEAIKLLDKKEINLGFKTCVLKGNEFEIKKIRDFSNRLGAFHRLDDMLMPRLDGSDEPYRYRAEIERAPSSAEGGPACGGAPAPQRPGKADFRECGVADNGGLFKCGVGQSQAAITPYGELKMCLMIDYPGYKILNRRGPSAPAAQCPSVPARQPPRKKDSLEKAWGKLKDLVAGIKPDNNYQCDNCGLSNYCKWCPAKSWLHNKSFTACNSEICYQAQRKIKKI